MSAYSAAKKKQSASSNKYLKTDFAALVANTRSSMADSVATTGPRANPKASNTNTALLNSHRSAIGTAPSSTGKLETTFIDTGAFTSTGTVADTQSHESRHPFGSQLESSLDEFAAQYLLESSTPGDPESVSVSGSYGYDYDGGEPGSYDPQHGNMFDDTDRDPDPDPQQDESDSGVNSGGVEDGDSMSLVHLANNIFDKQQMHRAKPTGTTNISTNPDPNPNVNAKPPVSKKKKKLVWKTFIDAGSGEHYYYNRVSRETTWSKPTDKELLVEC